jgi:hypothetical protein
MRNKKNKFGAWAFLIGIVLALVVGIFSDLNSNLWIMGLLVFFGLVIGLLNISNKEVTPFLMSGIILILASAFGMGVLSIIPKAVDILSGMLALFVPAVIIVSIKNVFLMTKN